jgi:hypothetical protein
VIGLSCHRHPQNEFCEFDASVEASGPHDFAVRNKRSRLERRRVHRIPYPTSVTIAKRPSCGTGCAAYVADLRPLRSGIFLPRGMDRKFESDLPVRQIGGSCMAGCASSFETHRFAMLLRMRSSIVQDEISVLMVRSAATPRVSNHESTRHSVVMGPCFRSNDVRVCEPARSRRRREEAFTSPGTRASIGR